MCFNKQLMYYALSKGSFCAIRTEDYELNYKQLAEDVARTINFLAEKGINSKSIVGITLVDELDHLIITLALFGLGATQIILPSHDSLFLREELTKRIKMTDLIISIQDNINYYGVNNIGYNNQILNKIKNLKVPKLLIENKPEGTILLKTSGTTNKANIISFTESQIALQAQKNRDYSNEALLRMASIEHNNSKRHRLYAIWNGGTNVFKPVKDYDVVDYVLQKKVSCIFIARIHASSLIKQKNAKKLSHVKILISGSSVPYSLRKAIEKNITQQLYVRYAATECGVVAIAKPGEHDEDECSGKLLNGVKLEIVDANDHPLLIGEVGNIRLKAEGMADRYLDNPMQTAKRFKNGWFYPGDLAYLRDDGQLAIQGRYDDMIIMNGLNIYPAEIEKVLESHPSIKTAAALPIESAIHCQIPVAAVELMQGSKVKISDLLKYCREKLALRSPKRIIILERLPRNSQSKILKYELKSFFV